MYIRILIYTLIICFVVMMAGCVWGKWEPLITGESASNPEKVPPVVEAVEELPVGSE